MPRLIALCNPLRATILPDALLQVVHVAVLVVIATTANQTAAAIPDVVKVAEKAHPRTVTHTQLPNATLQLLGDKVKSNSRFALPVEPDVSALTPSSGADAARASLKTASTVDAEAERLLASAYLWLTTQDEAAISDAKRRALNLAAWSPRGATGVWYQDQAARSIAWSLALAYDWLYSTWSPAERAQLLHAIKPRVEDMLGKPVTGYPTGWAGLDGGTKLDRSPYDSHGVTTLARLAVICSALAGEDPLFNSCYHQVVPRYVARPIPWGGDDGGFGNGTTYAHWGVFYTHFPVWDLLKTAIGVDLWQTKWAQNHVTFLAYFLPPGTPTNLFGDGAESRWPTVWAAQAKVYAAHYSSPLADWYARNLFGEEATGFPMLVAPRRQWDSVSAPLPPGTPNAAHIQSTGWVAMHSALGDRARTSIYFKSSSFGSFNHSHADQNSFVVNAKGRSLAIDSGYYDFYGSPHWTHWYKQTRAHNAITFDGGNGQLSDTIAAKGQIVRFSHTANHDITTGDATAAYGGALSRALRTLVYARPDVLLVVDALASDTPRSWEWNIHALNKMLIVDKGALEINNEGVRLCVNVLDAPDGAFSQNDKFSEAPQGNFSAQWHARYVSNDKSKQAQFVVLLDIECKKPAVALTKSKGGITISIDSTTVDINSSGVPAVKQ